MKPELSCLAEFAETDAEGYQLLPSYRDGHLHGVFRDIVDLS